MVLQNQFQRLGVLTMGAMVAALASTPSWAYIPPSGFILKSLARKHAGYKRIRVKSDVVALGRDGQAGDAHFHELFTYSPASGTLKSTVTDDKGAVLFEKTLSDQAISSATQVLLDPSSTDLVNRLKQLGLPILTDAELEALPTEDDRRAAEVSRLGRIDTTSSGVSSLQTAWVIGKDSNPQIWPQLWIEKDTFLPLRLLAPVHLGDPALADIRYSDFRNNRDFLYPKMTVWIRGGGASFLRAEATEVAVDGADTQAKRSADAGADGWTAAGLSAPGGVRDLIRDFYTTIR